MPECREQPQAVENDLGVDRLKVIQFTKILDRGHTALVVLEVVPLEERVLFSAEDAEQSERRRTSRPSLMFSRTRSATATEKSEWYLPRS